MPTTANDLIVRALTTSQMLLQRLTADLQPAEWLHRPVPQANCAAWIVGHLALSDRRVLPMLGATAPELPAGFERQFGREEGCPQAQTFGDVSVPLRVFNQTRERLIEAVRAAPAELLDKPVEKPFPMFNTVGEAAQFMALHTLLHAGQISTIRRTLGRPPVI